MALAVIGFRRSGHHGSMALAASRPSTMDGPERSDDAALRAEPGALGFAELVEGHVDFVWRLLRRLGLSEADAEDATQQVLLVAADKLAQIDASKVRTFLYGVALRVASNARRGERRRWRATESSRELEELRAPPERAVPWPDDLAELARAHALLDELLEEMPGELRRVLVLAEIEQCTMPEIAELEGVPVGTATSRLRRARALFAQLSAGVQHKNPLAPGVT